MFPAWPPVLTTLFLYRTCEHHGRKNERRSFSERDYIALLDAAHRRLSDPIVLVWNNCETQEAPPRAESDPWDN